MTKINPYKYVLETFYGRQATLGDVNEMDARKREPRKTFLSTKRVELKILFLTEPTWMKGETEKSGDRLVAQVKNLEDDQIYQLDQYEPIGNDLSVALVEVLGQNVLGKAARLRGVAGVRKGKDGKEIEFLETVKVEPITP